MKRFIVVLVFLLAVPTLFADELTPEKRVYTGRWGVERLAIASDGETYGMVIQAAGRLYFETMTADGDPLSTIQLPDDSSLTEPQIAFDGANFVVVARNPAKGVFGIWLSPDGAIHGPAFVAQGDGFSLSRNGDESVVVVRSSLQLFGANLKAFRLTRDYSVAHLDDIAAPVDPISVGSAFAFGRAFIAWTEPWVRWSPCQIGGPCPPTEALRFAVRDSATGSTYVSPQWSTLPRFSPRVIAGRDGVLWLGVRLASPGSPVEGGFLRPDETPDEPVAGGSIVWDSVWSDIGVAFSGSRFLVARNLRVPADTITGRSIALDVRWVDVEAGGTLRVESPSRVISNEQEFALGSTGDGRVAIVYSKYEYSNSAVTPLPDVYMRIAGQHEPTRTRAVRR